MMSLSPVLRSTRIPLEADQSPMVTIQSDKMRLRRVTIIVNCLFFAGVLEQHRPSASFVKEFADEHGATAIS